MSISAYKARLKLCRFNNLRLYDAGIFKTNLSLLEIVCMTCSEQRDALNHFFEVTR